jgi:vacuolar-type H+-ATPase subunit E/Vma4
VTPFPGSGSPASDAERLAALIREQAAGESEQAVATAREQAQRIAAAGDAEAEAIRAAAEREGEARGQRRAAEILAAARAQRRMRVLQARETLIESALARARAQLASPNTLPAAAETLTRLIREGLAFFPPGEVRVRMAERDVALLDAAVRDELEASRWTLRFEPAVVPGGGVIMESADRRRRVDNSIEARSLRQGDRLRHLAAGILLPDGAGAP